MAYSMNLFGTADQTAMWQFLIEMAINRLGKCGSNVYAVAQQGNRVQFAMEHNELVDYLVYYYAFKLASRKRVAPELQFLVCTKEMRERNIIVECSELEPLFGATMFKILDNSWTEYPVIDMRFNPMIQTTHTAPDSKGVRRETEIRMHAYFLKEFMSFKFKTPFPHVFKELENAVPALKKLFPNHQPDALTWLNNELRLNWQMYYIPFDVHYVTRFRVDSGIMFTYNEHAKKVEITIPYKVIWRVVLEYDMIDSPMDIVEHDESTRQMYQAVVDKGITPQILFNY